MPDSKQSILLGALVTGLLSTSYLSYINLLCCLGVIAGALVAVWHYTDTNELTIPTGKGAGLGAMAAMGGTVIAVVLNLVLLQMGIRHDLAAVEFMVKLLPDILQFVDVIRNDVRLILDCERSIDPLCPLEVLHCGWGAGNRLASGAWPEYSPPRPARRPSRRSR